MTHYPDLYEALDSANHSVSFCAHQMDLDPSDRTIADYERALDRAALARKAIGGANWRDLHKRDVAAGLVKA